MRLYPQFSIVEWVVGIQRCVPAASDFTDNGLVADPYHFFVHSLKVKAEQ